MYLDLIGVLLLERVRGFPMIVAEVLTSFAAMGTDADGGCGEPVSFSKASAQTEATCQVGMVSILLVLQGRSEVG